MAAAQAEKREEKKFSMWDLPDVPDKLPPHLEFARTRVQCNLDAPVHTEGIIYSGAYASMGVDNSVQLDFYQENF
ncbi:hypothetical protein Ddye_027910 [Dipteronia dyeriana]|uniref:Uncharacterized protein n=1 Tax=Dipteronia dyeriana TaxID=168575 RepID=A0AAD9TQ06_9ROSI|nr:hypothetical protein Ddye_027910 [Dipteronia dyeriana]